ncbi:hypothetical protein HDU98_006391 [Podochytrium sp. JEL0797]|nr:hypothetical protein HDU98_006391 [Podochytrium sp. JEL0797]
MPILVSNAQPASIRRKPAVVKPAKSLQRFLFATDSFSLSNQPIENFPQALNIDSSIFAPNQDLESIPPLAFGKCVPLNADEVAEREDLRVSVKVFLPTAKSTSATESIRESIQSALSLLQTPRIDSLVIQLPHQPLEPTTPSSPPHHPPRKSRRLDSQTLPSPGPSPTSLSNHDSFTWTSLHTLAKTEFKIPTLGVSSSSVSTLLNFLAAIDPTKTPLQTVTFDRLEDIRIPSIRNALDSLESMCTRRGITLTVSNDGEDGLAGASLDEIIAHVNSSAVESVVGVSRDWVAKYSVWGEERSTLLSHG